MRFNQKWKDLTPRQQECLIELSLRPDAYSHWYWKRNRTVASLVRRGLAIETEARHRQRRVMVSPAGKKMCTEQPAYQEICTSGERTS